ncbi:uncharacterized protein HMPREF1541_01439 [Cyphellophora europaea CBS 101466]|uniref:Zn(2)-C6 fungal-type domain-containing protein n=1 Tax=Cyphellophora europaea (strain CBS 101466) TaxID=1220924 RepID=W2SEX7_CYPE1|nr:uncharacterized protein HMPREF1541_01439 [Cyphellophora europaea CBS 101466]ETN47247.1 hypothetical protein HMPREF1541_01439 [Cyphellophora europaea CBS 101466]
METQSSLRLGDGRPVKRRKAQLACNYCRDRKTRCDGQQPSCTPCQRRGRSQECMYENSALRTQRYVTELEQRIKDLERTNVSPAESNPANSTSSRRASTLSITAAVNSSGSPSDIRSQHGSAPAGSYLLTNPETTSDESLRGSWAAARPHNEGPHPTALDPSAMVLPPRRLADSFVDAFFLIVHPLWPVVHKPTFLTGYNSLWAPSTTRDIPIEFTDTPLFWTAVNLVFAIGSQLSHTVEPSRRASLAAEFYARANRLCTVELIDTASVQQLQTLLLTSIYLKSTPNAARTWNVVGLAVRAAHGLGLHLEQTHRAQPSQLDREVGRRLWYDCVIMDRLLSLAFNRPAAVSDTEVLPPSSIDDEYLLPSGEGVQPAQQKSYLLAFTLAISLNHATTEICSMVASHTTSADHGVADSSSSRMRDALLQHILRIGRDLEYFEFEQLLSLRAENGLLACEFNLSRQRTTTVYELHGDILRTRLWHARLALHRPLLFRMCAEMSLSRFARANSLDYQLVARASETAIQSATSLIAAIYDQHTMINHLSPWFTASRIFTAAVCLLVGRNWTLAKVPATHVDVADSDELVSEQLLQIHLKKATTMLELHKDFAQPIHAAQCILNGICDELEANPATTGEHAVSVDCISRVGRDGTATWLSIGSESTALSSAWLMHDVQELKRMGLVVR